MATIAGSRPRSGCCRRHCRSGSHALDGKPDVVCLLVADIRHQGRGSSLQIRNALASSAPEDALLRIGSDVYPGRVASLKQSIRKLRDDGRLGRLEYDAASGEFH